MWIALFPLRNLWQNCPRPLTDADEPLHRAALLGQQLLSRSWPILGLETIHNNLIRLLAEAGFGSLGGHIKTGKLVQALAAFYPKDYLVRVNGSECMGWLERLIRRPRTVQAPIRYLLALGFLNVGLEHLLSPPLMMTPVARVGGACQNVLCERAGPMTFVETVLSRDVGGPVDLFRCEACGRVVAPCSVGRERQWVRDYGPVWRENLATMWDEPVLSLRKIARTLGVDPNTVKRQALKNRFKFPRLSKRMTTTRGLEYMFNYKPNRVPVLRRRWLSVQARFPTLGITALRRKFPRLFASLYRADREWLMAHRPQIAKRKPLVDHAHWSQRDDRLAPILKAAALSLRMRTGSARKVTATALLREAGREP